MALSPVPARALINAGLAVTSAFTRSTSPALMASKNPSGSITSVTTRFYPHLTRAVCTLAFSASFGASVAAQTPAAPAAQRERPALTTEIPLEALTNLPASSNLYSILDTIEADVISDRFDTGGLGPAQPSRLGAHGSTWTQTQFRMGDLGITDPTGSGTPLFMPGVLQWERIDVNTGVMPVDVNAPGLAITLTPRRPTAAWTRSVGGFFAPAALHPRRAPMPPPASARVAQSGAGHAPRADPPRPHRP